MKLNCHINILSYFSVKEHNVFFGMDYIIQGTVGGEISSATENKDTLPDVNDDDAFIDEVPQGINDADGGSEEYQSLHNSIKEESDVQPFTFIDTVTESRDGLSQDHLESEGPSGVKKRRRTEELPERPWDVPEEKYRGNHDNSSNNQLSQLSSASHNIYMDTLKRAQVPVTGMKGRFAKAVVSEQVLKEDIVSLPSEEVEVDIKGGFDEDDVDNNMNNDEDSKYPCKRCGTVFEHHSDLMKHVTTLDGKPRLDCRTSREGLEAKTNHYGGLRKTDPCRSLTIGELKKFKEWRDASIAKCALCGWEESRSQFGQHLRQWHKTFYRLYKLKHGSGAHMLKEHQCQICGQFIELEQGELQYHFTKKHNLKTVDYYKNYVSGTAKGKFVELPNDIKTDVNDFNTSNTNKQNEIEHSLREEMDKAFDKCEYFCRICSMEHYSAQNLTKHLKSHPGITSESTSVWSYTVNKEYGPLRTKSVRHNCLICNGETFHTRAFINSHLRRNHSAVTLHEYYRMFIGDKNALQDLSRIRTEIFEVKEEAAKLVRDLDKCEYFCRICNAEFWNNSKLISHIKSIHQHVTLDEYKEQFGPLLTKLTMHKCRICGSSFRHTKTNIENHLRNQHEPEFLKGLSLEIYQKRYMNGHWYNQCWFDCRACQEKFMTQSDLQTHIQLYHIFKNIDEYTKTQGPLNTTSCRICHNKFFSQSKLEIHIQQEHIFESISAYIDTLGPLMTKNDTHECRLCNEIIYCTESVVLEHLSQHEISLEDYNERFMEVDTGALDNDDSIIRDESEDDSMNGSATTEGSEAVSTTISAPDYHMNGDSYVCTICSRKFKNLNGINGHLNVHRGPRRRKQL